MTLRAYEPEADRSALWSLKTDFETALGDAGEDGKSTRYADKLSEAYRKRWLAWVDRCVADRAACVTVAEVQDGGAGASETERNRGEGDLVGYVFVFPERLAFVWDAAVVNELYVAPAYRGTGVADDLLTAAVDVACRHDLPLDRLLLDVDPENDRAAALYERHGFEPWGEILARPLRED
ncbi:GNAT family N-acetyltransferase [Halobacteriales archaeon QH_7_69_31]|nr:MAG: GNAT family N-acetyltransferase [Halobacteriales archaeon QH_7_69_31]